MPSWRTGPRRVSLFCSIAVPGEVCLSGLLDLFKTSESDATPHIGDGLHWPDVRGWLQTHPQTLLDDRSLLEEIGLRPHGRNVVEFGAAALTRLEAVVERETGAWRDA